MSNVGIDLNFVTRWGPHAPRVLFLAPSPKNPLVSARGLREAREAVCEGGGGRRSDAMRAIYAREGGA
jgi:hypothetical protein